MGILILATICTVAEGFLIYFLVQLVKDSRRESKRLRFAEHGDCSAAQFDRFEIAPTAERAVWHKDGWVETHPSDSENDPRDDYWAAAHRA